MKPYKERIEGMTIQYEEFLTSLYEQGYKDGQTNWKKDRKENDQDYQDGLADGRMESWGCVRRIVGLGEPTEIVEEGGLRNFICKYSAE